MGGITKDPPLKAVAWLICNDVPIVASTVTATLFDRKLRADTDSITPADSVMGEEDDEGEVCHLWNSS